MATTKYQLPTLAPIDVSLTAGTSIPSPPESPEARCPTPGGGPLSSHPTTPLGSELGSKSSASNLFDLSLPAPISAGLQFPNGSHNGSTGMASPLSPTSNPLSPTTTVRTSITAGGSRRSVRNLLGLRSFSANAASSADWPRPESSGLLGKRPSSPSMPSSRIGSLRKRKSVGWFWRSSSYFGSRDGINELEGKENAHSGAAQVNHKLGFDNMRMGPPPPTLPELAETLDGGSLGGSKIFQNIQ